VAVVMTHHYPSDRQALDMLLDSRAPYIGMLGPLRRTERMLNELSSDPAALTRRAPWRVHAPLGLNLGAEKPVQIALSAIAEIQAVLAGASARRLSERGRWPIHQPMPECLEAGAPTLAKTGTA